MAGEDRDSILSELCFCSAEVTCPLVLAEPWLVYFTCLRRSLVFSPRESTVMAIIQWARVFKFPMG